MKTSVWNLASRISILDLTSLNLFSIFPDPPDFGSCAMMSDFNESFLSTARSRRQRLWSDRYALTLFKIPRFNLANSQAVECSKRDNKEGSRGYTSSWPQNTLNLSHSTKVATNASFPAFKSRPFSIRSWTYFTPSHGSASPSQQMFRYSDVFHIIVVRRSSTLALTRAPFSDSKTPPEALPRKACLTRAHALSIDATTSCRRRSHFWHSSLISSRICHP
ncbi:hypothetical protein C8F04DRAFT_1068022 [Mycena alexandri]|uniref:Uncharacterized protein n=1 Tax=Mycena alexandri TaxID=1745969 RepID=A0AAD6TGE7_9AGAR|nr:hypothetical protein C8F04DRAFT_1068022 [Mycena alexandri]